jgi:hypothetical protein
VLRGSDWGESNVRSAERIGVPPDGMLDRIGFRCAVSP